MIKCKKCNILLDESLFYKRQNGNFEKRCKKCINDERKRICLEKKSGIYNSKCRMPRLTEEQRLNRKLELQEYHKQYRKYNADVIRKNKREYINKIKMEGISHYGGKCNCCGEMRYEFLTLEHLNGRDKSKKKLTGKKAWAVAKSENYPNTYTILCFNCNCAKGIYGSCPHTWKTLT